jgi:hypothetical protein
MSNPSDTSARTSSNTIRVPGELRLRALLGVLALFLAVDGLAYGVAARTFRRYQAAGAATSDKRLEEIGDRLDAIERQLQSLAGDVSTAATMAAAAAKESQAAAEGVRRLEQPPRDSRRRTKK